MGIPVFPESGRFTNGIHLPISLTSRLRLSVNRSMASRREYRPGRGGSSIAPTSKGRHPLLKTKRVKPADRLPNGTGLGSRGNLRSWCSVNTTPPSPEMPPGRRKSSAHDTGKGKGDALLASLLLALSDIIVMIDGDGSTTVVEITRFVAALVAGADYAKGSRFANSGGSDDINPPQPPGQPGPGRRHGPLTGLGFVTPIRAMNGMHLGGAFACPGSQLHRVRDRDHDEYPRGQGRPAHSKNTEPRVSARARAQ